MMLLEISVAAISANAPAIIVTSAILSAVVLVVYTVDDLWRNHAIKMSGDAVHETSWNNDKDGVCADGVPFYGNGLKEEL